VSATFAPRGDKDEIETGRSFAPRFDEHGLIPVIAADAGSGEVLMFAWMNEEALRLTIATGDAHYFSRSRNALWRKGETSGNTQRVVELRTDCDQDALLMRVAMGGEEAACHVGYRSCFYRTIPVGALPSSALALDIVETRIFDPDDVYGHDSGGSPE
jgi:phosphoribosyl-AMP cyclohydrolase